MIVVLRSFVIAIAVLTPSATFPTPAWESKPSTLFGLVMVAAHGEMARGKNLPGRARAAGGGVGARKNRGPTHGEPWAGTSVSVEEAPPKRGRVRPGSGGT